MNRSRSERLLPMKNPTQHLIAEVPHSITKVGMTIGIDLGAVWSHYCTLNEDGEVVDRGRFRTSPSGVERWFTDRLEYGSRWKRERIRSGSANSLRNWVTRSS